MYILHNVGSYDCVKICFHKIEDKIDIFVILGFEDIK
jgi:hypothetical protein